MQIMIKSQVNWIRVSFLFCMWKKNSLTWVAEEKQVQWTQLSGFHFSHQPMSFFQFSVLTKNFLSSILWYSKIWFALILILYFTAQLSECWLNTSYSMTCRSPGLPLMVSLRSWCCREDGILVEWSSSLMTLVLSFAATICHQQVLQCNVRSFCLCRVEGTWCSSSWEDVWKARRLVRMSEASIRKPVRLYSEVLMGGILWTVFILHVVYCDTHMSVTFYKTGRNFSLCFNIQDKVNFYLNAFVTVSTDTKWNNFHLDFINYVKFVTLHSFI